MDGELVVEPGQEAGSLRAAALASTLAGRWSDAVADWERFTAATPDDGEAWGLLILSYREAGRLGEADRAGGAVIGRFPHEWRIASEWALVPFVTRDWPEAAQRWQRVRAHFPGSLEALWRSAAVAEELGEQAQAAGFLFEARRVAGDSAWALTLAAEFFERRGAWRDAADMWRRVAERDDAGAAPVEHLATCLNASGKFDEAETATTAYLARAEPTETILREQARAASGRSEWRLALRRWQAVVDAYPDNVEAQDRLGDAQWHSQVSDGMAAAANPAASRAPQAGEVVAAHALDPKALAMCFESLGDNCEFGIFQRYHGAEPIGLYRWGAVAVPLLIEALYARFEGLGEPENTELTGQPGDEYTLRDRRHWLESHTFVPYNEEQFPRIFSRQTAAVQFLRERLLQDLEEPWKILVYKPRDGVIADHESYALRLAIESIGDAPLICVRVPDDEAAIGTVERISRGLYVGNIARVSPTARKDEIDFPGWLTLCRLALEAAREDGYQVGAA